MKILVLDNYDSFVYNITHLLETVCPPNTTIDVVRNNSITISEIDQYDKILLSPGPGVPKEAGIMPELITQYADKKSILGICLGHQAIGEAFGARLYNLQEPLHGIYRRITILNPTKIFNNIPNKIQVGHYHSWAVEIDDNNANLEIMAIDEKGRVMALKHKHYNIYGVQFHPESILTEFGKDIIKNWVDL